MTFLLALAACVEPGTPDLSDWTEGYEADDVVVEDPARFQLNASDDLGYPMRLGTVDDMELNCGLEVEGTVEGYEEVNCRIDQSELDLYGSGMSFDLYIPTGTCEYVVYQHPQFEVWEVGTGPTEVSFSFNSDGTFYDEVNSINGVPYCQYDYSWADQYAPNCCTGTYQITATVESEDGSSLSSTSPALGWGGLESDCYDGAAFWNPEASFAVNGFPLATIVPLYGAEYNKRFEWDALSTDYFSNMVLASYYDPNDHDGMAPEGLMADYSYTHHTFECYDHAEELLARITLDVREWNEQSEYTENGDPDTTGTEPVTGLPIDDRDDWATGTPGTGTWIQFGL